MHARATVWYEDSVPAAATAHGACLLRDDLEAFRDARGFDDVRLADWLGVTLEGLAVLANSPRPNINDLAFVLQCQWLAYRTGCDSFSLRTVLRWLHGGG